MRRTEKYCCDLCGEEFDTEEECREHETKHYSNWGEVDNKKIAEALRHLSNTVLGYLVSDFSALMIEAAKRLEEAEKRIG